MVTKGKVEGPVVGAHVRVPWGVDDIDAIVVERYGEGPLARAVVRVAIRGASGEELTHEEFSLPLTSVVLAD